MSHEEWKLGWIALAMHKVVAACTETDMAGIFVCAFPDALSVTVGEVTEAGAGIALTNYPKFDGEDFLKRWTPFAEWVIEQEDDLVSKHLNVFPMGMWAASLTSELDKGSRGVAIDWKQEMELMPN